MFKFSELKQIHLEITNNCQASCPMCGRNNHGGLDNPLIRISNWSLEKYKTAINLEVLSQVESIYFCGNFGDPLLNNDLIDMVDYSTQSNPNINIRIHTNGSLRSIKWWQDLAKALPKDHLVIFAIDGLADTHSIYRIGTDYNQILKNAQAFMEAGGIAEWAFIRFKHNAHQVETAKQTALELGFKSFVVKDSSRFLIDKKFPVLDRTGSVVNYLEPAEESKIVFVSKKDIENYKKIVDQSEISCQALRNKEVYIDAFGHLFPCCWLASTSYSYIDPSMELASIKQEIFNQHIDLINDFKGIDNLDIDQRSIKDIIDSTEYQTLWSKYWNDNKLITCVKTCGTNKISKPVDQFIDRQLL